MDAALALLVLLDEHHVEPVQSAAFKCGYQSMLLSTLHTIVHTRAPDATGVDGSALREAWSRIQQRCRRWLRGSLLVEDADAEDSD